MPSTVMLRGIALVLAIGSAAPVSALTLAEAYEAALGYDAQFLASRHELASARLDVPIARALLMPSASFSASTSRVEGQREFANSLSQEVKVPLDYTSPSASLSFRAPLFNYDALSRTRQAYSAVDAAEQTFKARQTDLVNRLTSVYLQTAGAIDDRRLAEWEVQALRGQLERSRQRQSRGEGTLTEVARTEAALELARAKALEASDNVLVANRALRRVTGLQADRLFKPTAAFKPRPLEPERLQDWMDMALRQNPALRSRELNVVTALRGVDRARAGHMPRLDLVASLSQSRNESPTNVNQTSTLRSLGLQLNVPLFNGGGVDAGVRQSLAERDKAEENVRADREAVLLDVERFYRAVTSAPDKIQAYERAVQSSQTELRGATRSQELGLGTVGDVLEARTRYNTALRDLSQARLTYLDSRLRLLSAAGVAPELALEDIAQVLTEETTITESTPK